MARKQQKRLSPQERKRRAAKKARRNARREATAQAEREAAQLYQRPTQYYSTDPAEVYQASDETIYVTPQVIAEPPAPVVIKPEVQVEQPEVVITPEMVMGDDKEGFAPKMASLIKRAMGPRMASPEEATYRRDVVRTQSQSQLTETLIDASRALLDEKAKSDARLAEALKVFESGRGYRAKLGDKLRSGEELTPKEFRELVSGLHDVTDVLRDVGLALNVDFPKVLKQFSSLVNDNRLDLDSRRGILSDIKTVVKQSGMKSEEISKLLAIDEKQFNATEEETKVLNAVLDKVTDQTKEVKLSATMENLEKTMDSVVLTQGELKEFMKRKETESALKKGLGALSGSTKSGIMSTLFSAMGLGGMDQIIGDLAGVDLAEWLENKVTGTSGKKPKRSSRKGKGILGRAKGAFGKAGGAVRGAGRLGAKGLGALGRGATGLLGGIGTGTGMIADGAIAGAGMLGKGIGGLGGLAKGGARLLGKAALPLALLTGAWDFGKGFTNAEDIAGMAPGKKAGFGTKMQAGVSSMVEGLSFGMLDAKSTFQTISKGMEFLVGQDGILTKAGAFFSDIMGKIGSMLDFSGMFDTLSQGFDYLFGESGLLSGAKSLAEKALTFGTPMGMAVAGVKKFFGGGDTTKAKVSHDPSANPDQRAANLSTRRAQEDRITHTRMAENSRRPIVVTGGGGSQQSARHPGRMTQVDDLGLQTQKMNMDR